MTLQELRSAGFTDPEIEEAYRWSRTELSLPPPKILDFVMENGGGGED